MRYFLLVLFGLIGGVLGGMGLGGGTVLIPLLVFFMGVSPRLAGWTNLFAFLPTAAVALFFHAKNRMIDKRFVWWLLPFAFGGVFVGFLLLGRLSEGSLRRVFGGFLILTGLFSIFSLLRGYFKKKSK